MARKDSLSGQRYACDRPGCDKHYSRPDHLLRHKLNHDREKVLECDQCDRTFVRQDLLTRHLERHALRGRTLGRWIGKRKQSADSDGEDQADSDSLRDESVSHLTHDESFHSSQAHSDMRSGGSMHFYKPVHSMPPQQPYDSPFAYAPPPAPPATHSPHSYGYRDLAFVPAGSSSTAAAGSLGSPMPYEMLDHSNASASQHSQPRGPYARPSNSRGSSGLSSWPTHQPQHGMSQFVSMPPPSQTNQMAHAMDAIPATIPEATALLHSAVSGSSHFPFSAPTASDDIADYDWLFDGIDPLIPGGFKTSGENMLSSHSDSSTARESQSVDDAAGDAMLVEEEDFKDGEQVSDALHDLAFFASLQSEIPEEDTFHVDNNAHVRLLHFLSSSMQELAASPLFSPQALRCYVYLFFTKLNTIYPLIHQPTFNASLADPMLLSAMIVCGAHFADESAHFLAERIGRKLWGAFISFEDFRPARATLALLQAMLLTETFGKMMGTRPQHETAHLFHNFIVTLARRNAVFVPTRTKLPSGPPEERWRAWAREEEKKRISLYAFILDAQHATIFRHIPALSSFQIHLSLPCDDDEWQATSANEWSMLHLAKSDVEPPSFIAALKATLTPSRIGYDSDSFKHFVLLHGLMSVAYDLQWKQQALLAAPETGESVSNWREKLMVSYHACKQRLDSLPGPLRRIDKASRSLIDWAQIVLHADAVDIQIYAGLPTVMGRFIDHHTFSVARKSCREWGKTEDARIAVWHTARFLFATLFDGAPSSTSASNDGAADEAAPSSANENVLGERSLHSGFDEMLHEQWLQYLCALLLWVYEQAQVPVNRSAIAGGTGYPRPRSAGERDADSESCTSSSTNTNANLTPADSTPTIAAAPVSSSTSTILQRQPGPSQSSVLANPVPKFPTPLHQATRQARQYLTDIVDAKSHEDMKPRHSCTPILELVERQCRTSRWEIGREASGVLRKLIRERLQQQSAPSAAAANISLFNVKIE